VILPGTVSSKGGLQIVVVSNKFQLFVARKGVMVRLTFSFGA
jgi:hypothetical protein